MKNFSLLHVVRPRDSAFIVWAVIAALVLSGDLMAQAPSAASAQAAQSEELTFVSGIRFTGNSVFASDVLEPLVADRFGSSLSLAELRALAARIDAHYHAMGYLLARTVIPQQDFARSDRTVEFRVLEGTLGEIRVQGSERFSDERVARMVRDRVGVRPGDVVHVHDLERALAGLNRSTDLELKSSLQPGQSTGSTDLVVQVHEPKFVDLHVEANNFGSAATGRYRVSPGVHLSGLSRRGDSLAVNAVLSPESSNLYAAQLHYRTPVRQGRTQVAAYVSAGNFDVGRELSVLEIEGRNFAWGVGMSRSFVPTPSASVTFDAWFEARDLRQQMLGFTTSDDRIRKLRVGATYDWTAGGGRTLVGANIHAGLGERFGGMAAESVLSSRSFARADNSFTRLSYDITRVQPIAPRWLLLGRLVGQHAFDSLVAGEQWAIGGAGSVRGHAQSAYSGDSGQTLMLEARYSLLPARNRYQLVTFAERGRVSLRMPLVDQPGSRTLSGAGVGVRASIDRWQVRADVGVPVGVSTDGNVVYNAQLMFRF